MTEETPKPAKDSPEYADYLRAKLQDVRELQLLAKINGDEAWALTCATEAKKVELELRGRM